MGFSHTITIGAAGAVSSQDAQSDSGVVAAKTATAGNYTLTFPTAFKKIVEIDCAFIGALGAVTTGCALSWLSNNLDGGTKAGTIVMQWVRSDTNAAADVPSGTVLKVTVLVEVGV